MMRLVSPLYHLPLADIMTLYERGEFLEVIDVGGEWWGVVLEAAVGDELLVLPPKFTDVEGKNG